MTFSIRELGLNEVAMAQRLVEMWRQEDGVSKPPPSSEALRRLLSRPDFHVLIALREDEVIGGLTGYELEMYTAAETELFIYEVGVAAAHRRQGVGRALIEHARNLCRARGLSALYVPAMADDARAVAFYLACGLKREDVAWFVQDFETND